LTLFDASEPDRSPLAERLRPERLEEVAGQKHLTGEDGPLGSAVRRGRTGSLILWGPPGSGKTTLARLLATEIGEELVQFSAVESGVKELRKSIEEARGRLKYEGRGTILFVDEVHRFNKAQQDALLPVLEEGVIDFVGATTENPSFEVIPPMLSRSHVLSLSPLSEEDLTLLLERGSQELGAEVSPQAHDYLLRLSGGDGRRLLNALEAAAEGERVEVSDVERAVGGGGLRYGREEHYDTISAFIKSVRGGDPDAGLHYLARMIAGGEDPVSIARRLVILASEDVGNADPYGLTLAVSAARAAEMVGMPEGRIPLAQATTYLASAPKSNASYKAIDKALEDVRNGDLPEVPLHLRQAPTDLMKKEGYGEGYRYAHDDAPEGMNQRYLPQELSDRLYYEPLESGEEEAIGERLARWRREHEERGL
jgi:putative ATPase